MTPGQREELKQAALAADQGGQHIYTNPRDSNNWSNNETWHAAASPAVVLSLIAQVEALTVPQWISVEDRLPADRQRVMIMTTDRNIFTYGQKMVQINIAVFVRGRTAAQVSRDRCQSGNDQAGNNKVPYGWEGSPKHWFGQDVTYWMPLPAVPTIPAIPGTKEGA